MKLIVASWQMNLQPNEEVYAPFDGIILYQAVCLGVKKDDEIIACGKTPL